MQSKQINKIIAIGALTLGILPVFAQNLSDRVDTLNTDIKFGYTTDTKISIKTISEQVVTVQSPIIKTSSGSNILKYTVMYSEHPLADILNQTDLLDQAKEKSIELTGTTSPFSLQITTSEGIDPTKTYYAFMIPKDGSGNLGEVSNEVWFNMSSKTFGEGNVPTTGTTQTHNAAGADMSLAHITHTINGNTITLKRIPVDGSNNVDIMLFNTQTSSFMRIGAAKMEDGMFAYTTNKNGEHIFQLTPDNGGKAANYTATINTTVQTEPNQPTNNNPTATQVQIKRVPKTGAQENIIAIIILSIFLYYGYKRFVRKAK